MKVKEIALDGIVRQNPTLKLVLGTCSVLALSTNAINGLGMGVAVTFVLVCSNVIISLLRKVIPDRVRIPAFTMIIATFVTIVKMVLYYFASKSEAIKGIYDAMGVFLPLIVVNCIILARAESFASHYPVGSSALDGLFMGVGYTLALTLMGIVRELLGTGWIFYTVNNGVESGLHLWDFGVGFFTSEAGAFLTYGLFIALFNFVNEKINTANKLRLQLKVEQPTVAEVK